MENEETEIRRAVILSYNEEGEITVGVQGGQFTPTEVRLMCQVAEAKVELLEYQQFLMEQNQGQSRIVVPS